MEPRFRRVNAGCGPTALPGYVNLDIQPYQAHADLPHDLYQVEVWDVRKGLPFPDGSMLEVRADQFLEHLTLRELVPFLEESHRVLVDRGEVRFSFPDIGRVALEGAGPYMEHHAGAFEQVHPDVTADLVCLNFVAYGWEHRSCLTVAGLLPLVSKWFTPTFYGHTRTNGYIVARKGGGPDDWRYRDGGGGCVE